MEHLFKLRIRSVLVSDNILPITLFTPCLFCEFTSFSHVILWVLAVRNSKTHRVSCCYSEIISLSVVRWSAVTVITPAVLIFPWLRVLQCCIPLYTTRTWHKNVSIKNDAWNFLSIYSFISKNPLRSSRPPFNILSLVWRKVPDYSGRGSAGVLLPILEGDLETVFFFPPQWQWSTFPFFLHSQQLYNNKINPSIIKFATLHGGQCLPEGKQTVWNCALLYWELYHALNITLLTF